MEDNADDEQLTLRGLRKCANPPEVDVARDGAQAVEFMLEVGKSRPVPDLVILDLKLPKLSGIEVLRRLRTVERMASVSVVILSSSDEERDVSSCYASGANSYVCKPVDYQAFLSAVRSIGDFWLETCRLPVRSVSLL